MKTPEMTRIDIDPWAWNYFRSIALRKGITTPQLLGTVVRGYVVRDAHRRHVQVERRRA